MAVKRPECAIDRHTRETRPGTAAAAGAVKAVAASDVMVWTTSA